jgi:hypothetical protein
MGSIVWDREIAEIYKEPFTSESTSQVAAYQRNRDSAP